MKKFFSHTLIFLFFFTVVFGVSINIFPQTAQAQIQECIDKGYQIGTREYVDCAKALRDNGQPAEPTTGGGIFFELLKLLNPVTWVTGALAKIVAAILGLVSMLTGLAGLVLNHVVNFTIVEMSENYNKLTAIKTTWATVRDVANMGFIFVLLYASIQMILGIGKNPRELIVNMIIAAILINFSLFFTQVIIDASNILALVFYKAITSGAPSGGLFNTGLAAAIMEPLKLEGIWSMAGGAQDFSMAKLFVIGVMGSIVSLVAAFVLFAIALMFIIRYVALIFVLILSPIAIVSAVLPKMEGYWNDWKKALFGQAFFAPVYMFLAWITISIFQNMPSSVSKGNLSEAFSGLIENDKTNYTSGTVEVLMYFIIVIVFLIATLIISKKVADSAGMGINKLTSKALGAAGGASFGMAGRMGRGTFGRLGAGVADSATVKNMIDRGGAAGAMGRLAELAGTKAKKSSWDIRGSALGDSLEAGKVKKGTSFSKDAKDREGATAERVKMMRPNDREIGKTEAEKNKAASELEKAKTKAYEESTEYRAAKEAVENAKTKDVYESDLEWEERQHLAVASLASAEQRAEENSPEVASAKSAAERAALEDTRLRGRAERYAKKQGGPDLGLPKWARRNSPSARAIHQHGLGGAMRNLSEKQAEELRARGGKFNKARAMASSFFGKLTGLRDDERKARARAAMKEARKTKEEIAEEKRLKEFREQIKKEIKEEREEKGPEEGSEKKRG